MDLKRLALTGLLMLTNKAVSFYRWEIPLTELQRAVEDKFPISKEKYLLSITLCDPLVNLEEANNRIGIEFTIDIDTAGNFRATWRGAVYGSPHYDREKGEFYLLDLKVHRLDDTRPRPRHVGYALLEAMLNNVFSSTPILRLQEGNVKHALAKLLVKSVIIGKEKVIVELGLY